MKYLLPALTLSFYSLTCVSQEKNRHQSLDLSTAFGKSQHTVSLSAWNHWYTGNNKKLEVGIGLRLSAYFGNQKDFITAPAKLSRGSSIPFLVVVSSQETANWDTLTIAQSHLLSINTALSAQYHISPRLSAGFNIDLVGFTLGKKTTAAFTANGQTQSSLAKPTGFNILLTGDLDYGSLNSAFYLAYKINEQFTLRGVYQFYFAEYTTPTKIQQLPEPNDRFRNKANLLGLGISFHFKRRL